MRNSIPAAVVSIVLVAGLASRAHASSSTLDPQAAAAPAKAAAGPSYQVAKKFKLGGEGGWDYLTVDGAAKRVYLSHGTHVMVVDSESGAVVGDIPDTPRVHGIALAPDSNRGFISNGGSNNVTIFDLKTLKATGQVKTGEGPDAILFDPATKRVFTFNGKSRDATAIDSASGEVAGTVPLGGKPEAGVADGAGHVYVNIEDTSEIVAFDAKTLKVSSRWPLAPGDGPSGLAMDVKSRRLFSVCHNEMMVMVDADSGKVVATAKIGRGVDGAGFDPELQLAFASNGDGTLTVVHEDAPDKLSVVENAQTQRGARTMTLDPKTHRVYLACAEYGPPPAENPNGRPIALPNSFTLLVMERR